MRAHHALPWALWLSVPLIMSVPAAAGQVSDSPCVDGGDPASDPIGATTRTDGLPDEGIVDMGYHYPGPACFGDVNGDGRRNFTDFTAFALAYGSELGDAHFYPHADLNGDGEVGFEDFIIFGGGWLAPCP